jgi:hypothetical protein
MDTGRPVKWIETRREHLLAAAHAREHTHEVEEAAIAAAVEDAIRPLTAAHVDRLPLTPERVLRLDPVRALVETGDLGEAGLVEDLHLAVTHPHQPVGLKLLEHPVDAGPGMADQFGETALAQVQDAVLRSADED